MSVKINVGELTGRIMLAAHAPFEPSRIKVIPVGGEVIATPVKSTLLGSEDDDDPVAVFAQPVRGVLDSSGNIRDRNGGAFALPYGAAPLKWKLSFRARLDADVRVGIEDITVEVGAAGVDVSKTIAATGAVTVGGARTESAEVAEGVLKFTLQDGTVRELPDPSGVPGIEDPGTGPTELPTTIARRLVVIGDSHSDNTAPSNAGTWWWQVAADRAGLIAVDNFAARGWDTQQAIDGAEGMPSQLMRAEESPADLAVVMLGGNDVAHSFTVAKYRANLVTISNRLKASGKRVVIVFPPPLFDLLNMQYGTVYQQMRAAARAVAAETGAYYTDPWDVMARPDNTSDPKWDSGDTVHFNDEGQYIMGMAVADALQSFAAVEDPWGGDARTLDWARPSQHSAAGGRIVRETMFQDDPLFRSDPVARITGGTGETVIYADTGAVVGERIRVEYPYRVTVAAPVNYQKGLADFAWTWPSGSTVTRLGSTRVLVEGVRRYEVVVPAEASAGFTIGAGLVDTTDAPAEVLIGAARISVITPQGAPYRVVELPAPAYQPAATEGTGGKLTDQKNITWASGTVSSIYHQKASHLTGNGPFPLVIHLHGDGYEEVTNYGNNVTTSVAYGYEKTATDAGALFVMPRTPDTTNQTWYAKATSTTWLVDLVKMLKGRYNVDERRIFFSGYSGGAEELSYNIVCDYHTLFKGGGAMMLGGGGANGLTGFTGIPSDQVKAEFLLRWWYGETDNGVAPSDTSINAITASASGEAWYKARGFDTKRTMIPGKNHYTSEVDGPAKLAALIAESNQKYGIS